MSDAATDAWVAAVQAAGGTGSVSPARKALVDNLIAGLKADGIWAKLDRLYLFAAENPQSARIDLVGLAQATIAAGAPPFTVDIGYYVDWSNYINLNYNPTTDATHFTQDSCHFGAWNLFNGTSASALIVDSPETSLTLYPKYTDGKAYTRLQDAWSGIAIGDPRGWLVGDRSNAAGRDTYQNGVSLGNIVTGGSSAVHNSSTFLYSGGPCSAVSFGGSLTATEHLALYNRLNTYMTAVGVTVDPTTLAWADAVAAAGGTVSYQRRKLVDNLIAGLKADGVWAKLDRLYLLTAENTQSALVDLVELTQATLVNSPTFTPDRGYTCNGTAYVDTGFIPSTHGVNYTLNTAHISIWSLTSAQGTQYTALANPGNTNIFAAYTNGNTYIRINNNTGGAGANTDGSGFFLGVRASASSVLGYRNNTQIISTGEGASALDTASWLAYDRQISSTSVGGSMDSTDATNYYIRLATYMAAVGVPVQGLLLAAPLNAGHPVLAAPAMTRAGNDVFAAAPALATASPVLGAPVLAQSAYVITAGNLAAGHPVFGAPAIAQMAVACSARPLAVNHPFVGKPSSTAISNTNANTETDAWVSVVQAQAGTVSPARGRLVDALISGLKVDAIWTKIDRLWLLATDDQITALVDIRNQQKAVTDEPFTANQGYFCSASDGGVFDTNFSPNLSGGLQTQNSAHIAVWNLTDGVAVDNALDAGGTGTTFLNPLRTGAGGARFAINDQSTNYATVTVGDCRGFMLANRSGVSARQIYLNGVSMGAVSGTTSTTRPENSIIASGDRMLAAISLGPSLNATEQLNYYNRVRTYLTGVGVQTGVLVARSLAVGEPQFTFPAVTPPVVLAASALAIDHPVIAAVGVGLTMVAMPLVAGAPTLSLQGLLQTHVFSAGSLAASAPVVGTPAMVGAVPIAAAAAAAGTPVIGATAIGQTHALAGAFAGAPPALGSAIMLVVGVTSGYPLVIHPPALGAPALGQVHALATAGLPGGVSALGAAILAQTHVLASTGLASPPANLPFPFLGIVGQTQAVPLITGRPVIEPSTLGLLGLKFVLNAAPLAAAAPLIGIGRETGFPPQVWLLNRWKWWQESDPDAPYYDADGTEDGGLVQEAIFSNLNDDIELTVSEMTLVGRTTGGRGPAEAITVELPLYLFEGKLWIDWTAVDGLAADLAAEVEARLAAVAATNEALAELVGTVAATTALANSIAALRGDFERLLKQNKTFIPRDCAVAPPVIGVPVMH